jgi:hypothetical protein
MRSLACAVAALAFALVIGGCSEPNPTTVEVAVRMVACADDCLAFPLPNASVQVMSDADKLVAKGTTDDTGEFRCTVATGGMLHIVVTSAFLKNGMKDTYAEVSGPGTDTTVTLLAPMSAATIPAPT